jgi:hypothetical protein
MLLAFESAGFIDKEDVRVATSVGSLDPIIPDFEKDAAAVAAYNDARVLYERGIASDAEERARTTYEKKRAFIRAEIAAAASFVDERKENAERALRTYVTRYPRRRDGNKPVKPSFWEMLVSLGWAGWLFERAVVTADEAVKAQSRRQRWQRDEDELEAHFCRTLYLEEDARKKFFQGPEASAAFHARPGVANLRKRVAEIKQERTQYASRLENGEVSATEQRERGFAEEQISPLTLPFVRMTIVRIARYGDLTHFILRDFEGKLYDVGYDPRLEPLIDNVLDAYRVADCYEMRLSPGRSGRPMPVADHYAACFKDEELGRSEYRQAREALSRRRTDVPPMTFHMSLQVESNEHDIVELLASFAQTLKTAVLAGPLTDG